MQRDGNQVSAWEKGSLSVFFALILPMLLSLFFSMLEVTRICGLDRNSEELAKQMVENAFSEYQPVLWERYGILALDMGYSSGQPETEKISGRMMELGSWYGETEGESWMNYLLALSPQLCEVTSYGLLTDNDGAPLIRQGAEVMGNRMASDLLSQWVSQVQGSKELQDKSPDLEDLIERGQQALLEEEKSEQGTRKQEAGQESQEAQDEYLREEPLEMQDNPLDLFAQWKEKGLLGLVLPAGSSISSGCIDTKDAVSGRVRNQGTRRDLTEVGLVDKVLFSQYVLETFSLFTNTKEEQEHSGMAYEAEYILGGKASDRENLESVAVKILLLREVQNLAAIYMDPVKVQKTQRAALSIAGITANPLVIQAVQVAVAAVWAFVESVLDMRLLFSGGTVPIVKRASEWTSDLTRLGQYVSLDQTAKSSEHGMTYSDYLRIFLALLSKKELGLRACDVIEEQIRATQGYEAVRADHLVYELETICSFQAQPVFFRLVSVGDPTAPTYSFTKKAELSY